MISDDRDYSPAEFWREAEDLGRAAQVSLEYFQALGLAALDIDIPSPLPAPRTGREPSPRPAAGAARPPASPRPAAQAPPGDPSRPAAWAPTVSSLTLLEEKAAACQACALGLKGRGAAAGLGRGSAKPLIAFVGPTPAIFEAEANDLLAAMIEKGLRLAPDDFYITTLLKCPRPEDQDFPAQAAAECLPLLHRELSLLRPPIVLALGGWPGRFLSGRKNEHLLMLRQQTHTIFGLDKTWLRVTYGLEDLLSTPELKKEAWKDLQKIIPVIEKLRTGAAPL